MSKSQLAIDDNQRAEIWKVPTQELRGRLGQLLTLTANTLSEMAEVWIELERRGEDLSALRSGLMTYVRLIARREILPEAVVRYAGHKHILTKLAKMPLYAQEKLMRAPEVEVVTNTGIVSRKLHMMSPHEAEVALGTSGPRSIRSQRGLIKQDNAAILREKNAFRVIVTPISSDEYDKLKALARNSKVSVGTIVRQAVEAAGHFR